MAIVSAAKKDFEIVSNSEDLLNFVKERTLDKKFKIRKEANSGLAMIYKKHLSDPQVSWQLGMAVPQLVTLLSNFSECSRSHQESCYVD